jgi:hypothetical protein
MSNSAKQGYILILAVMFLSIGVVLVSQLFEIGSVHIKFDNAMIQREQAKQLTHGCVQLALSQLSVVQTKTGQQDQLQEQKKLLTNILAVLNQWQVFELKKDIDGIDATIGLCLISENGKIDLNAMFDFKEKKFKGQGQATGDMKKIWQSYCATLRPFFNNKDICEPVEKFLKEHGKPLLDVSELFGVKEIAQEFGGQLFAPPPDIESKTDKKRVIYLTDLFTVFSRQPIVQPLFLSDAVRAVLGLKRATHKTADIEKVKKQIQELLKDFNAGAPLQQIWDKQLQPIYGKDFKSLPAGTSQLFDAKFEPTIFSVLCYANVGTIRQELWAILEKQKPTDQKSLPYVITRLYWLP